MLMKLCSKILIILIITYQVHFRKIYEVLDMPKPERKKWGPKDGAAGDGVAAVAGTEPAVKKIKTEEDVKMAAV